MYECIWKLKQLVQELRVPCTFIQCYLSVFKTSLQGPDNTISLLFVAMRKFLHPKESLRRLHDVRQVGQYRILEGSFFDTNRYRTIVLDSVEDLLCGLLDIPSTMNNIRYPPSVLVCFDDGNSRLVQLGIL